MKLISSLLLALLLVHTSSKVLKSQQITSTPQLANIGWSNSPDGSVQLVSNDSFLLSGFAGGVSGGKQDMDLRSVKNIGIKGKITSTTWASRTETQDYYIYQCPQNGFLTAIKYGGGYLIPQNIDSIKCPIFAPSGNSRNCRDVPYTSPADCNCGNNEAVSGLKLNRSTIKKWEIRQLICCTF